MRSKLPLRSAVGWTVAVVATVAFTMVGLAVAAMPGVRFVHHHLARTWARVCVWVSGCRVVVEAPDGLPPGARFVVMANHQSALDIPVLMATLPAEWRCVFWAKRSLFRIPVLGWAMRALGHLPVDRINRRTAGRLLTATVDRTRQGRSVLVFPEETYSRTGELLPFQRGGFLLAIKTAMPILPVGVSGTRHALPPGRHLIRPTLVTVRFGEPITTESVTLAGRRELSERTRQAILALSAAPAR